MVLTENTAFASWFGLRENATNAVVWPTTLAQSPQRHPSRRKGQYRLRGANRSANPKPSQNTAPTQDHRAVWQAKTTAAKKAKRSRELRIIGCFSAAIAGLATVGVLTFQQGQIPTNQASSITVQTSVVGPAQTPLADLAALPVHNFNVAPQIPTQPDNAVMTANDMFPPMVPEQTTSRPSQPAIMDRAPRSFTAPSQIARPRLDSRVYPAPEIAPPTAANAPQLPQPFVCTSCVPAFPQFGQVMFDVQSSDIAAASVQNLMAALAKYQSTVRQSRIEIATSQVRFYRARDAQAAASLASLYGAELVDLTWFAPTEDIAKIDVILARQSPALASGNGQ